ncbi:daptide-type RiPP biosynthesis methyltransferase [Streptomyces triticirhizae]|uniref:Class I SAM-dependent methyltransferase n=1 Tax=Streptomyces triticirhizae TaxID=2483353 RepID=A0A3M2LNE6_9ACTN|nr:daptide-type RiPP biosynthesis methyltransferase [Streptomyces triticirhizae]RMI38646.1 class I SAM-dependent methyltransferase [Streptomyces triticirhizae]
MTDSRAQLLGTAAQVAELFGPGADISDMYGAEGAALYHGLTRYESAEIEEMLRIAKGRPGPLLELACGTGRITVPFLREGYETVGLDFSTSMLELLKARMTEDDARDHADQLTTVHGDMTDFKLNRKFGLILLGASAVWNVDAEKRASLFASVRDHLAEDGRFLLTLIEFDGVGEDTDAFETTLVFAAQGEHPALVTFFDYVDPAGGLRSTNMVRQAVVDGQVVKTSIHTALTHLVAPSVLEKEIESAGLKVVGRHDVVSGYEILKASSRPVAVRLMEISH